MAEQNPQQTPPTDPYAAFGGRADTATPSAPQAAPTTAPAITPAADPYAAFGGHVGTETTGTAGAVESGGNKGAGGGGDRGVDNTVWGGFSDKIGKAASGLWELTKAQTEHVYNQYARPVQDVAEGHYKKGVWDALQATVMPDIESPVHHVVRGMVIDSLHNLK